VRRHDRAFGGQPPAYIEAGRVTNVVAVRLERQAERGDALARQRAADRVVSLLPRCRN